jgi:serine/threonine protein kinase
MPVVPGLSGFSVLARGGYATVYRAMQDSVAREVAVKVENRTLENDRDQRRFLREARAAGRMSSHPHVVDLFDAGVTVDQQPFLIMELCDGSYADRMRTTPLTALEARDLGVKIADALGHAHQSGVLHRDVKPANILYSRFNSAVLADFGLAVLAEVRDSSVTLEVLTPAYAPPEMFRHSAPSPAVDVYALCATLYAVMRGKPPRWHDDRNPSLITLMELFSQPIPELPGVPTALIDVLRAGMANDPGGRPYAEQLRDMLAAVPLAVPGPATVPDGPPSSAPVSGGRVYGRPMSAPPFSAPPVSAPPFSAPPISAPPISAPPISAQPMSPAYPLSPAFPPARTYHPPPSPPLPPAPQPGHREPTPDDTPTVKARRRRRFGWLFGGSGALVLLVAAGVTAWMAGVGQDPDVSPSDGPGPTASAEGRSPDAVALPGCLVPLPANGRCPDTVECFGAMQVVGGVATADAVACGSRHTWEVYAIGDLPVGSSADDLPRLRAQDTVRRVCNEGTFRTVSLRLDQGWRFEVLPPTVVALQAGDRTFRCLAGKGPDRLTGPTLARTPR